MKKEKTVYVASTHRSRTTIWAGTIEELRTNVFGYTLECGNSWNNKINREPKTVASLVNNLNKSVSETQGGCYDQDYYEVATKEQYEAQEAAKAPKQEVESSKVNNEQEVKQSNNSKNMTTKKAKTVKDIIDDKNLKLTEKELALVVYLNDALRSYFGEVHSDVDCNDIAEDLKWDVKTVKGVVGSLVKKNIFGTYDTGTGYDVVNFVGQYDMSFYHFKADELPVPTKAEKKPKAEADKKSNAVNKPAKTARKVGEVHPKHPTWIWTEYAEGKFDWRTNPADKKQGQRNDKKDTLKQGTHKATKKDNKSANKEKKELTIEEFIALPKTAKGNKKPSEAQAKALKLINKGYQITADKKFFEKDDIREVCNWDSVVALFRRYGIEYIPEGLVKSCNTDDNMILEAAYLAGYEPSEAVTTADEEVAEAMEYLTNQDVRL